ncbi:hypothetical protein L1887_43440 [Cichorium endivia]|nr:hypothetical protein L1887_43440 [Cichorium endivia]
MIAGKDDEGNSHLVELCSSLYVQLSRLCDRPATDYRGSSVLEGKSCGMCSCVRAWAGYCTLRQRCGVQKRTATPVRSVRSAWGFWPTETAFRAISPTKAVSLRMTAGDRRGHFFHHPREPKSVALSLRCGHRGTPYEPLSTLDSRFRNDFPRARHHLRPSCHKPVDRRHERKFAETANRRAARRLNKTLGPRMDGKSTGVEMRLHRSERNGVYGM